MSPGLRPDLYPFAGTPRHTTAGLSIITRRGAERIEGGAAVYMELDANLEPTGVEWVAARHLRLAPYVEALAYAEANQVSLDVAAKRFSIDPIGG